MCVPQAKCDSSENDPDSADAFSQGRLEELSEKMKVCLVSTVLLRSLTSSITGCEYICHALSSSDF